MNFLKTLPSGTVINLLNIDSISAISKPIIIESNTDYYIQELFMSKYKLKYKYVFRYAIIFKDGSRSTLQSIPKWVTADEYMNTLLHPKDFIKNREILIESWDKALEKTYLKK